MKIDWKCQSTTKFLSNLALIVLGVAAYFLFLNFSAIRRHLIWIYSLFAPFIYGFIIAYLLNGPVSFFERRVFRFVDHKKPRPKIKRVLSIFTSLLLALIVIVVLLAMVIPQLVQNIVTLIGNMQGYLANLNNTLTEVLGRFHIDQDYIRQLVVTYDQILKFLNNILSASVPALLSISQQVSSGVMNVFLGVIISIYLLNSKEIFLSQVRKILNAFLAPPAVQSILGLADLCHKTFSGFIFGKIIDSAIISVICYAGLLILQMPFALLISAIIGVTNIIPFFGPFIGAVPTALIVLIAKPGNSFWIFLLFVFILQQFDGNVLGPKILGQSTGLPSILVMFAIILGGGMFGFTGMVIGVPTFAVLYTLFKALVNRQLRKKGLPTGTSHYQKESGEGDEGI